MVNVTVPINDLYADAVIAVIADHYNEAVPATLPLKQAMFVRFCKEAIKTLWVGMESEKARADKQAEADAIVL